MKTRLRGFLPLSLFCLVCSVPMQAQLTTDQKITDFKTMAAQFAKRYVAPLWKETLFGVNMWDIQPFLDRVTASRSDLDFYDICIDYVAQFHDGGHVFFAVPSDFIANTGISVDTYDGKPLIYAINRTALPASKFSFQIGDEIISIDGVAASDLMTSLAKYGILSNPRTAAAYAAQFLTVRPQSTIPYAINVPDASQIVIRGSDGTDQTYTVPWMKTGVPLTVDGPVGSPFSISNKAMATRYHVHASDAEGAVEPGPPAPLYSEIRPELAVTGIGALRPVFTLPPSFKLRLGANTITDAFYSGTFQAGPYTIGFLRIPSFSPAVGVPAALAQFSAEIAYFNANTDGLILDDSRNPGGLVYYGEELIRHLIPRPFRYVGFELRSTEEWVRNFDSYVQFLTAIRGPQYYLDFYGALLNDVNTAFREGGHTGPEPIDFVAMNPLPLAPGLDQVPLLDTGGSPVGYAKPMMVLTDEFSFSGADFFAATMQDNKAATLFGFRTGGLGGTNASYNAGAYSEAVVGMLRGFMVRSTTVSAVGYPATNYVENVGVQPDIVEDYKTKENLLNGGATFVARFTSAMVALIQQAKQ